MSWVQSLRRKFFGLSSKDQEQIDKLTEWITDEPTMIGLLDSDQKELDVPGYQRRPLDSPLQWDSLPTGTIISYGKLFFPDGGTRVVDFANTLTLGPDTTVHVNLHGLEA